MYLALVRGLLPCVVGDWSGFDSKVDRLDEGVCVLFPDNGVSQTSQLSAVSSSSLAGLPERRPSRSDSFSPRGVVSSTFSERLRRAPGDFCAGESTPNSCQNEEAMSAGLESLPDVGSAAGPLPRDEDDEDLDLFPATDSRSRLRDLASESRFREFGGASEFGDDIVRDSVPLIPSSPTVACRISSRNVHRPSRRSEAICLPVRISASRDGGGMVLRHCASRCSGT